MVTWWAVAVGGVSFPAYGWLLPSKGNNDDLPEMLGLGGSVGLVLFYTACGLVSAVTLPWVIAGAAIAQAGPAEALLVGPGKGRRQLEGVVAGSDAGRAAEKTALSRLERDIHDGPQQRLFRLSMDLGRARSKTADVSPEIDQAFEAGQRIEGRGVPVERSRGGGSRVSRPA